MSAPHSVVFLGTSAFAVPSLKALATDSRFSVQVVVTQPDKPVGRKQELAPPPVKVAAEALTLPVEQPDSLNGEFDVMQKKHARPDFLVVVSYGQILSGDVLNWPIVAAVNVHASLLPTLRGASPIQHAILEGLSETGVTVQRMAKELDAGPILTQQTLTLDPRETFVSLHDKLAELGASLLTATLSMSLSEREQDHAKATVCKKLKKSDGLADPQSMTAETIDRMVRALTPWPGVTYGKLKLLKTSLQPTPNALPLPCAKQTVLFVEELQPSGGKPMTGQQYLRGKPQGFSLA